MPVSKSWDIHAISVQTVPMGSAVVLQQVTEYPLDANVTVGGRPSSGQVYPRCLYMLEARPQATLSFDNIAAAVAQLGVLGFPITSNVSRPGVVLYGQQHEFGATRLAGANHKAFTVGGGIIVPRRLTADNQSASITYDLVVVQPAGMTSEPVVVTNSVSLPALSATESYFRLGKVTVGGTVLNDLERVTIDFGINLRIKKDGADYYPSWVSIQDVQPTIDFEGGDLDYWATSGAFTMAGTAATHANTLIQLRKVACGGRFIADATTEHLRITAAGLVHPTRAFSGDMSGAALQMRCSFDGTNAPVAIATGAYTP